MTTHQTKRQPWFTEWAVWITPLLQAFRASHYEILSSTVYRAAEKAFNSHPKCAELLNGYIEVLLADKLEQTDVVITTLSWLRDLDVFEWYYHRYLARRLLMKKARIEEERALLFRLSPICGYSFVGKMNGMLKDFQISQDLAELFKWPTFTPSLTVLTTGYWPASSALGFPQVTSAILLAAPELLKCWNAMRQAYRERFLERKLTWLPAVGFILTSQVNKQGKITLRIHQQSIVIHTLTYLCLHLVSESELTATELAGRLGLTLAELAKYVMMHPKYPPLFHFHQKSDTTQTMIPKQTTDLRELVVGLKLDHFKTQRRALDYTQFTTTLKDDSGESQILGDRKFVVDAQLVRILKTKKSLTHAELVELATLQLAPRFILTPTLADQRINSLLEKQYIAIDPNDAKRYHYLA